MNTCPQIASLCSFRIGRFLLDLGPWRQGNIIFPTNGSAERVRNLDDTIDDLVTRQRFRRVLRKDRESVIHGHSVPLDCFMCKAFVLNLAVNCLPQEWMDRIQRAGRSLFQNDQATAAKTARFVLSLNRGLSLLAAPLWIPTRVPSNTRNRSFKRFDSPTVRLEPR